MATIHSHYVHPNHEVYIVDLNKTKITVTVTSAASTVKNWLKCMLHFNGRRYRQRRLIVGLGIQWNPFAVHPFPPDTLQLCINHRCLIFHLTHAHDGVPQILHKILDDNDVRFVGFHNRYDPDKLLHSPLNLRLSRVPTDMVTCLRIWYDHNDHRLENAPVRRIVKKYLQLKVEQRGAVKDSDWNRLLLTEEQVIFACVDAYCAFRIAIKIQIGNWLPQMD